MLAVVFLRCALDYCRRNGIVFLECSTLPYDEKLNSEKIQVSPFFHCRSSNHVSLPALVVKYTLALELDYIMIDSATSLTNP